MHDKILFVDTETGGLNPNYHSLLSIALVLWQDYEIIDKLEVLINDGNLVIDNIALEINHINIEEHKMKAVRPTEAIVTIKNFLYKHFITSEKITLAGHNISFDVSFLKVFIEKNGEIFSNYFSHRYVDTASILYYLYLAGKIKSKTVSSSEAFKMFGIKIVNRHSALGDAKGTAELFTKLLMKLGKIKIKSDIDLTLFES